jgi:hypothetical protein
MTNGRKEYNQQITDKVYWLIRNDILILKQLIRSDYNFNYSPFHSQVLLAGIHQVQRHIKLIS